MSDQVAEADSQYLANDVGSVVPEGYKQTEVGVIPEDWGVMSIESALNDKYLLSQMDGNHGELYPKSYEFTSFGVPYIGATDFRQGTVDYKKCKYLSFERANTFRKGVAISGDVLFAHNATVGPVALLKTNHDFVILSTTATYYRCNCEKLNNEYLAKYFESEYFVEQYSSVMSQSTRNQVPILAQREFMIVLPTLKEQTAIANALSDIDALISEQKKLIAKKQAIKTATMQQLLTGRTRLPQFALREDGSVKGYKQSELGEVPEDWVTPKFGEVCTLINGRGFKPHEWHTSGLPIIRIQNLNGSDEFNYFEGHFDPKIFVTNNQLLFAWSGSRGTSFGPHIWSGSDALLNYHTWKLVLKEGKVAEKYFFHILKLLTKKIEDSAHGASALVHTQKGEMEQLLVPLPTLVAEQKAIAEILVDMDDKIEALEQRLTKTQQIKQGMMQELLTGKTRLVKPEQLL